MIEDIKVDVKKLYDYLDSCNVTPTRKALGPLIKDLEKIIAIRKNKKYIGIDTVDGIIVGYADVDGIVEYQELPEDVLRGYYRYENGKIILDEKLRLKIWG